MMEFPERPLILLDQWIDATAVVSLASIYSRKSIRRDVVGFAVNSVSVTPPSGGLGGSDYGLHVHVALRGSDAHLYRVSFQLTVHARM